MHGANVEIQEVFVICVNGNRIMSSLQKMCSLINGQLDRKQLSIPYKFLTAGEKVLEKKPQVCTFPLLFLCDRPVPVPMEDMSPSKQDGSSGSGRCCTEAKALFKCPEASPLEALADGDLGYPWQAEQRLKVNGPKYSGASGIIVPDKLFAGPVQRPNLHVIIY